MTEILDKPQYIIGEVDEETLARTLHEMGISLVGWDDLDEHTRGMRFAQARNLKKRFIVLHRLLCAVRDNEITPRYVVSC